MKKDFSIVKIGGSQFKVSKGDKLDVEKQMGKEGEKLTFDEVLLVVKKGKTNVGTPVVKSAKVEAKIVEQFKGKKVTTMKYRAKSRYRKKTGHRQQYTKLEIVKI
jgi:large subunit ribosomal protein L21